MLNILKAYLKYRKFVCFPQNVQFLKNLIFITINCFVKNIFVNNFINLCSICQSCVLEVIKNLFLRSRRWGTSFFSWEWEWDGSKNNDGGGRRSEIFKFLLHSLVTFGWQMCLSFFTPHKKKSYLTLSVTRCLFSHLSLNHKIFPQAISKLYWI